MLGYLEIVSSQSLHLINVIGQLLNICKAKHKTHDQKLYLYGLTDKNLAQLNIHCGQ